MNSKSTTGTVQKTGHTKRNQRSRKPQPSANRRTKASLDVNLLTQKASPVISVPYKASLAFSEMPLHPALKKNISLKGFSHPTEIQEKTLSPLSEGRDLLGIAQTGTGKTGAFLIPIIDRLLKGEKVFQRLIMVPTRELAVQLEE